LIIAQRVGYNGGMKNSATDLTTSIAGINARRNIQQQHATNTWQPANVTPQSDVIVSPQPDTNNPQPGSNAQPPDSGSIKQHPTPNPNNQLPATDSNNQLPTPNLNNQQATPDRRTLRSRRALREAFAALAAERGLGNFSVSDLSERADLNRGTFYAHYKDMDDLLASFEDEIVSSLLHYENQLQKIKLSELVAAKISGKPPAVAIQLFAALNEHAPLLRVLLCERGDAAFQARMRDGVCANLVRGVLHKKYRDKPTSLTEYYIAYYAAGALGLIQNWLCREHPEPPEEIARIMLAVLFLKPGDPIELKRG
jgi:AcrR family transcriptional regulator